MIPVSQFSHILSVVIVQEFQDLKKVTKLFRTKLITLLYLLYRKIESFVNMITLDICINLVI